MSAHRRVKQHTTTHHTTRFAACTRARSHANPEASKAQPLVLCCPQSNSDPKDDVNKSLPLVSLTSGGLLGRACVRVRVRVCACARVWLRFHQTRARKQATAQHGTAHGRPGVTPLRHTNRGQANNQGHKPDIRRPGAQSVKPDWRTIRFIIGVVRVHTERGIPIVGHHTRAKAQTITPQPRAHAHTRTRTHTWCVVVWCGVVWCAVQCAVQ